MHFAETVVEPFYIFHPIEDQNSLRSSYVQPENIKSLLIFQDISFQFLVLLGVKLNICGA